MIHYENIPRICLNILHLIDFLNSPLFHNIPKKKPFYFKCFITPHPRAQKIVKHQVKHGQQQVVFGFFISSKGQRPLQKHTCIHGYYSMLFIIYDEAFGMVGITLFNLFLSGHYGKQHIASIETLMNPQRWKENLIKKRHVSLSLCAMETRTMS